MSGEILFSLWSTAGWGQPALPKTSRALSTPYLNCPLWPTCPLESSAFAGRDGCPQPSVRGQTCAPRASSYPRSGQRRVGDNPPYLKTSRRQSTTYLNCPLWPTCPLEGSAFAGRDGCPQPSVRGQTCAPRASSYPRSGQRRVGDNPPYPRHRGDNPPYLNPALPKNKAPRTKNKEPYPYP